MKRYIHITAGRGPVECCWVVAKVFLLVTKECAHHGLKYKVIEEQKGPKEGTYYSIFRHKGQRSKVKSVLASYDEDNIDLRIYQEF